MVNSFIKKEDFDKRILGRAQRIRGKARTIPLGVTFQPHHGCRLLAHSYGRPVIGNKSDVERVPIDRPAGVLSQVLPARQCRADRGGQSRRAKDRRHGQRLFGTIPRPTRTLTPTYTVEPVQDGERMTVVRRVGDVQFVLAVYHVPDGANPDIAALDVLAEVLGEPSSGRLYKALVDNKKATHVLASCIRLDEPGVAFSARFSTRPIRSMRPARSCSTPSTAWSKSRPARKKWIARAPGC